MSKQLWGTQLSVAEFLNAVRKTHQTGAATEHSYRPALQKLFNGLDPAVSALNEPKRVKVGAPDFVFRRGDISVGHCEAKDLDVDVRKMVGPNADQKARYLGGLPNLIYTNCCDWAFYRDGQEVGFISIAESSKGLKAHPDQFEALEHMLKDFIAQTPQTITSPKELAERMAGKAVLIKDILFNSLKADKDSQTELTDQYGAFKEHLIHDISVEDFADMYAETIAYGMFAARLHDQTLHTFSRQEALQLLPKSNPFLRSLFGYIAGPNLDERISWIIDDLAKVFQATNVRALMANFGSATGRNDPFLHFYETFLAAYNPAKRKARGVWYTPEAVVNFIVRSVDEVLIKHFALPLGLADTSKVVIDWDTGQKGVTKRGTIAKSRTNATTQKEVHKVQILDPATGTGTFLAEAIKQIAPKIKDIAPSSWSGYVERDLIPRLHGFELLMASYAMCHMKLDMILTELGYKPTTSQPRLGVYLTNSLEEGDPPNQTLPFAQWLSNEVRQANAVKRDMPIMCVIGNPPYSGHSANNGTWARHLVSAYKMEPGGKVPLDERNGKWLNDDYVKFIRMSETMIEKNGEGVLGFITNHSYLDNPTFRGMRWHLLKTFDKIYVLDLHGSTKKNDTAPTGAADRNVFDIQQGVAIVIAIKKQPTDKSKALASVLHADLWGSRETKYEWLSTNSIASSEYETVQPQSPYYHFQRRNYDLQEEYDSGFSLSSFFTTGVLGFQTHRDGFAIAATEREMRQRIEDLRNLKISDADILDRYALKSSDGWNLAKQRKKLSNDTQWIEKITPCLYRPFDTRFSFLDSVVVDRPRPEIVKNFVRQENLCLLASRQLATAGYRHILVSNLPAESCAISLTTKEQNHVFPLYIYPDEDELDQRRRVNFDDKLFAKIREMARDRRRGEPDEVAVMDYIYGALHDPDYREKYAEFLKIDFPKVPWPTSPNAFWLLAEKGAELRALHLMDSAAIGKTPYPLKGSGDGAVGKPEHRDGKIWINGGQYFDQVPSTAWDFWLGGYQPAQKWLKDRKGIVLSIDEIRHYQKVLKILSETDRIMSEIAG